MGNVRPLSADTHVSQSAKPKPIPRTKTAFSDNPLSHGHDAVVEVHMNEALSYYSPGMQKGVLRKLRRGHFSIEAGLDLHGLSAHEAKHELLGFLARCVQDGLLCVHIIHGKGYRSSGNRPILKNKLNIWLRRHHDVIAFCSSNPADGGVGAVYVLLRMQ